MFLHLARAERIEIAFLKEQGYSLHAIAKSLKRSISTISDELTRNPVEGHYDPVKADHKAYVRRRMSKYQSMKIVERKELRAYVEAKLWEDYSPEMIAGRIRKKERHLPRISKNAVYDFLGSVYGRPLEAYRRLRDYRRKRSTKRKKVTELKDRTFIDKRPQIITKRKRVGDAESDFILSGRDGKGMLLTLVDRKLRLPFIEKIYPISIRAIERALLRIQKRFPELKTITFDNDVLLVHHKRLERLLNIKIYFCHPYRSNEKGSIENLNGRIRHTIPKGADISQYSRQFLKKLELKLRSLPMKCINYETPNEAISRHRARKKLSKNKKSPEGECSD